MEEQIEQAIRQCGADRAPRITPADIEAAIKSEHFFTAKEGAYGAAALMVPAELRRGNIVETPPELSLMTICVLVLENGYTVIGESACASPENFDAKIGRRIARQNAIDKIWPLMGYELRSKLSKAKSQREESPVVWPPIGPAHNDSRAVLPFPIDFTFDAVESMRVDLSEWSDEGEKPPCTGVWEVKLNEPAKGYQYYDGKEFRCAAPTPERAWESRPFRSCAAQEKIRFRGIRNNP